MMQENLAENAMKPLEELAKKHIKQFNESASNPSLPFHYSLSIEIKPTSY
jgi:hypothetical protein